MRILRTVLAIVASVLLVSSAGFAQGTTTPQNLGYKGDPGLIAPHAAIGPAGRVNPGERDMTGYMRTDIFVFADSYSLAKLTNGALPSEYGKKVLDEWRADKVRGLNCTVTVRFSGFLKRDGFFVTFPSSFPVATYDKQKQQILLKGSTSVYRDSNTPDGPGRWYNEVKVNVVNGLGILYTPIPMITESNNPQMSFRIDGVTLDPQSLPEGAQNRLVSTPWNPQRGTENALAKALGRPHRDRVAILIVSGGSGCGTFSN